MSVSLGVVNCEYLHVEDPRQVLGLTFLSLSPSLLEDLLY